MTELLLRHGSLVQVKSNDGKTALIITTANQSHQLVALFLEYSHPDDIDIDDKDGNTALMIGAELGDCISTELLLKYQPLVNLQDMRGCTTHNTGIQMAEYISVTELLLKCSSVDICDIQ